MPYIEARDYKPNWLNRSAHYNTIMTALLRKVAPLAFTRSRLELEDGDFMDLDFSKNDKPKLAILLHGLEGDAKRPYMMGMAQAMQKSGLDTLNVNLRGCSGEPNRLIKSYHSGSTDDLQAVLDFVFDRYAYEQVYLIGFSLGGNIVLKYTGDQEASIDSRIKASIGISVPCDLTSCANAIKEPRNFLYMQRFLNNLRAKIKEQKHLLLPDMDYERLLKAKNFHEFDHWFTAKVNGFESAHHYWETCSSKPGLSKVSIPTLLINAKDDSFLGAECYPTELAKQHPLFHMLTPKYGGHVGFSGDNRDGMLWSEYQAIRFIRKYL